MEFDQPFKYGYADGKPPRKIKSKRNTYPFYERIADYFELTYCLDIDLSISLTEIFTDESFLGRLEILYRKILEATGSISGYDHATIYHYLIVNENPETRGHVTGPPAIAQTNGATGDATPAAGGAVSIPEQGSPRSNPETGGLLSFLGREPKAGSWEAAVLGDFLDILRELQAEPEIADYSLIRPLLDVLDEFIAAHEKSCCPVCEEDAALSDGESGYDIEDWLETQEYFEDGGSDGNDSTKLQE